MNIFIASQLLVCLGHKKYLLLIRHALPVFLLCIFLGACVHPSEHFNNTAIARQLNASHLLTSQFQHTLYSNNATLNPSEKRLHIYLDGDGTPWVNRHVIASDPTSRKMLILDLISMDKAPSILLGRPCYYGLYASTACHPRYWTSHRYAPEIVQSMRDALMLWLAQHPYFEEITFIGYSGGGALAMLLAPYFKQSTQVLTIAANLDTRQWTMLHGYSPLTGSLNPMMQGKLSNNIEQIHIAGAQDRNVPMTMIKNYAKTKGPAKLIIFDNQSHCCWDKHWLSILAIISTTSP